MCPCWWQKMTEIKHGERLSHCSTSIRKWKIKWPWSALIMGCFRLNCCVTCTTYNMYYLTISRSHVYLNINVVIWFSIYKIYLICAWGCFDFYVSAIKYTNNIWETCNTKQKVLYHDWRRSCNFEVSLTCYTVKFLFNIRESCVATEVYKDISESFKSHGSAMYCAANRGLVQVFSISNRIQEGPFRKRVQGHTNYLLILGPNSLRKYLKPGMGNWRPAALVNAARGLIFEKC